MIMTGIASVNTGLPEIKRFFETRKITRQTIPIIPFLDGNEDIIKELEKTYNFESIHVTLPNDFWTKEPLGLNKWELLKYNFKDDVIFTDIKDVIFQKTIKEFKLEDDEIIVQQERKLFGGCVTNKKWLNSNDYNDRNINSAGGFAVTKNTLKIMTEEILKNKWNCSSDQGAYNRFLFENKYNCIFDKELWRVAQDDFSYSKDGLVYAYDGSIPCLFHFAGTSKYEKLKHIYPTDEDRKNQLKEKYEKLSKYIGENYDNNWNSQL